MSEPNTPLSPTVAIPESLHRQLVDFRRHLWRVKFFEAVAAGFVGLLVSFLLVYGLDRIWVTPGLVRLGILLAGTSMFAVFAPFWLHRWVWRHRREAQIARLIARRFPGLGDRLLGVIELQDQHEGADSLSPRLRGAAMEAVAAEAGRRKLDDALPPPRHQRWALVLLVLAGGAAAVLTLTPRAGLNAIKRWLMPLSNTERYTFTRLENPLAYLAVPYGEAFEVSLRLSTDSERRPDRATGHYGLQPGVSAQLEDDLYHFSFPGQQDSGTVVFRVGDALHELRVEPKQRPSVEAVAAIVTPPAYLNIPQQTIDLSNGVLSAVEGSRVSIKLTTNRALAAATFGPTRPLLAAGADEAPATPGAAAAAPPPYTPLAGPLTQQDRDSVTPDFEVGKVPFEIPFAWVDNYGLAGETGFRLRIDALGDAAPACYLQGIERQKVMLPEETLDFEVLAEDDFGIKLAGLEWSGEFTKPSGDAPAKGEMNLVEGALPQQRMTRPASFSPKAFGIAPQKITLRGFAEDYFPGRGRVFSEPVTIYVLTRDEHAQLLKSQFDRTITELEDLARREGNQLDETKRLDDLKGEELQNEENRKRLAAQEQAEAENTRRMEDLTKRTEQLMKDAARNGDIDKETLRKIAESLKSMQELSTEDMPKVQGKMAEAQEQSSTPEKTDKDVEQAKDAQEKVVEKMKESIDKANDANRRMEAGTFVNRLKKAASEEEAVASSLIEGFAGLLGAKASAIDPKDARRLKEAKRQQTDTASDVRWIQEDLGHYFARTEKATFKQIFDEMRDSKIDIGLDDVRNRLRDNHAYLATEGAKQWSAKLTEWAKKLEGEMKKNQGGGGGDGDQASPEDEDFEFMLRVMKMIQQQQDLRARTRALEQFRRSFQPAPNPIPAPSP
ncbi:MAG: hypothetical protein NTW21_38635 [Verrucomicrobia bacterium]|nr:hypothetical protein [Verrucomicrobiota bacterium]